MIQYISGILDKISVKQRILALLLLLVTIITLTLGDTIIKAFKPDSEAKDKIVDSQKKQIESLSSSVSRLTLKVDSLSNEVSQSYIQCSNKMVKREKEIYNQIEELQKELTPRPTVVRSARRTFAAAPVLEDSLVPIGDSVVRVDVAAEAIRRTPEPVIDKSDDRKIVSKLEELKRKLKH